MPTIHMTCPSCKRGFSRRTRKGLRTSCPHCSHVMPGPEGQKLIDQRLGKLEGQKARRRVRERAQPDPQKPTPASPPAARTPAPRRRQPAAEPPAPATAPGTDTQMPRHPESKPQTPKDRPPSLFW